MLYPILKAAKRDKKAAYFNVKKLIINSALYSGEKKSQFSFYGRLIFMDNAKSLNRSLILFSLLYGTTYLRAAAFHALNPVKRRTKLWVRL